jgi:prophage regulatory protein
MNLKPRTPQPEATEAMQRIMRLPAVLQVTGLARSTVYRMMAEHTFPAPVKLAAVGSPLNRAEGRAACLLPRWVGRRLGPAEVHRHAVAGPACRDAQPASLAFCGNSAWRAASSISALKAWRCLSASARCAAGR